MKSLKETLLNKDLFPTKWSLVIFLTYMALFTSQVILVTASRGGKSTYPYNTTSVVLLTEVVKLVLSSAVFILKFVVQFLLVSTMNTSSRKSQVPM